MFGLKKRTWLIASIVIALIGTGAVASRYNSYGIKDRADFATYMITRKLELNDAQEASLDKLSKSWVDSAGTMKSFRNAMLEEVKTLATGENLSVEQVNALRDKIKAEFDRRADLIAPQFVDFYNGLDSEQKAKIVARLDDASKSMGKRGSRPHWGFGGRKHHGDKYRE
ncbi:MAG: Spy/CpxP family protein refolding chaperone [Rhizobiaceae bacterium]|nr:Spy/CpxP family protein refolding chaperone [Rhizobiaceae bacterium]